MFACETTAKMLVVNLLLRVCSWRHGRIVIGWGSWVKRGTTIQEGTGIGWKFRTRGEGRVSIGKYCAIGENVTVISSNHEMSAASVNFRLQDRTIGYRLLSKKRDVTIGHDVWIGDRAIILPGVIVGNGAVIAAGALVTRPVGAYEIVGGNPAKLIRMRFPEEIAVAMQNLEWWNWSEERMRGSAEFFSDPEREFRAGRWPKAD